VLRVATRSRAALAVVLVVVAVAPACAQARSANAVEPWIDLELGAIASNATTPPRAARALAHLSAAVDLAARAAGRRSDEAVAGAASTVLVSFFPGEADRVRALADAQAPRHGVAFTMGRLAGRALVERAGRDGAGPPAPVTAPIGPRLWVPTPPAYAAALEPQAGTWRTWHLRAGAALRPPPPPPLGSAQERADLRAVFEVARSLTDRQRAIANRWADGAGTETPPGHWNRIALDLVEAAGWGTVRAARAFALLNTAQADAFIACWDAKYAFWRERPVTAIRRELDPSWLPYLVTPPFPGYVSGHSATSGAAATVLAALFPKRADTLRAWAQEAAVSRLYAGIHFPTDNEAGLALGRAVARVALRAARRAR
jgi:membrane-associated phospholipid phosphatase